MNYQLSGLCLFCSEPIMQGDTIAPHLVQDAGNPRLAHDECMLRQVLGGLNHLKGKCTCCGGTLPPDPPGMSKRDAARAACEYWRSTKGERHGT